jgi:hypothetical protein
VTLKTTPLFREEQRFRDVWWVMLLVFGLAALQWGIAIQQLLFGRPVGNNPAPDGMVVVLWLVFGVGFPLFFLRLGMVVTVYDDRVDIRYTPLFHRVIPKQTITRAVARTYSPLREFGGWGVRGWGGRVAYNVRGDRGVELTLTDGRVVLLGSQQPEALAAATLG